MKEDERHPFTDVIVRERDDITLAAATATATVTPLYVAPLPDAFGADVLPRFAHNALPSNVFQNSVGSACVRASASVTANALALYV